MPLQFMMSSFHQAYAQQLRYASLSETAIASAHVLMRVLNFENDKSFSVYAAAQEAGLPLPEFRCAMKELIEIGALRSRQAVFLGHKQTLYRLCRMVPVSHAASAREVPPFDEVT